MDASVTLESTVVSRLTESALLASTRPFLRLLHSNGQAQEFSYPQLIQRSGAWREFYSRRGMAASDRIVVILPHSLDLYAAYLGAVLGGFVPAMCHFPSPKIKRDSYFATVGQLIAGSRAKMLVAYPSLRQELQSVLAREGLDISLADPTELSPQSGVERIEWAKVDAGDAAFLQYSSGTTGLKKAVAITHQALLWQVDAYAEAIDLGENDVIVSWLPLYHDMGLIACCWLPILTDTPVVAMSPLDWVRRPTMLLEAVSRYRGTLCWMPNFAYNHIAGSVSDRHLEGLDLSSLRGLVNCSEPVLANSHERLLECLGPRGLRREALWTCYAMAENTFAVTSSGGRRQGVVDCVDAKRWAATGRAEPVPADAPNSRVFVSSGRPLARTRVRIVAANGNELPQRAVGQILLRSPCLVSGYLNAPKASAEAFADGWYATGDLGYRVRDELFVTGRQKDLIIIAGKNVYPQDIEAMVNEVSGIIPGRCVALGLSDEIAGTEQLIVLAETHEIDPGRREQIRQDIFDRIAGATEVTAGDIRLLGHMTLVKSSSGKIARQTNLQRYRENLLDRVDPPRSSRPAANGDTTDPPVRRVVTQFLAERNRIPPDTVRDDQPLISSGWIDSLNLVHLILAIESELQVVIPAEAPDTLEAMDTIEGIAALVRQLRSPPAKPAGVAVARGRTEAVQSLSPGMSIRDRKCRDFIDSGADADLIILGSSRVMALRAESAAERGYRGFNFAVNGALAEDWYCIGRFVQDHAHRPLRRVLLGIDILSFSNQLDIDPRLRASPYLRDYLDPPDRKELLPEGLQDASPDQRNRLRVIWQRLKNMTLDSHRRFGFRSGSGDLVYLDDDPVSTTFNARQPLNTLDGSARNQEYKLRMNGFAELNPKRLGYLVRLVQPLVESGVAVTCFLTPTHRILHRFLMENTLYADRLNEFVVGVNKVNEPMFQFLDCCTPETFGGEEEDFVDAAHIGGHNADVLLNYLLNVAEKAAAGP